MIEPLAPMLFAENVGRRPCETLPSGRKDHITRISEFLQPSTDGSKCLLKKATGTFYTPTWMAQRLAAKLGFYAETKKNLLRIVDPFCGDGRLLVAFVESITGMRHSRTKWHFELWDRQDQELAKAKRDLTRALKIAELQATIEVRQRDTFLESTLDYGTFDLVLTNPPWESLKPDRREMMDLTLPEKANFGAEMRLYDQALAQALPNSQPAAKLYGWGTNLSRCGLELATKLLAPGGACGIVLPASTFADQASTHLRQWLLERNSFHSIDYYPAEAKAFEQVDQPCVCTVFQQQENSGRMQPLVTRYSRNRDVISQQKLQFSEKDLKSLEYRIPVELNTKELALLLKLAKFRPLTAWATSGRGALWMGRELDETDYRSFLSPKGRFPFIKGRDIGRFCRVQDITDFVNEDERTIPSSARFSRVTWRDVSRRSQNRRMQATLIDPNVVTGNSLHVAYFIDNDRDRLLALLATLNSLIFEFQLRSRLGTGHISLGAVRQVSVPDLDSLPLRKRLARLANRALDRDMKAEIEIESVIADVFELSPAERNTLLEHFPNLSDEYRIELRNALLRKSN